MASLKSKKNSKSAFFTLTLVAALLLSVYVVTGGYNLNIGSRAFRSVIIENGRLVLPTETNCTSGNYALVSPSGRCRSVVASSVDDMVGSNVSVTGYVRRSVLYAESVTFVSRDEASPTPTPRVVLPTRLPGRETPAPYPVIPPPRY